MPACWRSGFAEHRRGRPHPRPFSLAEGYEIVREAFIARLARTGARASNARNAPPRIAARGGALRHGASRSTRTAPIPARSWPASASPGARHDDLGGYHLVWTRDAVEAGLGLIARSASQQDAARMLAYLVGTQRPDGRWAQNFFPDGRALLDRHPARRGRHSRCCWPPSCGLGGHAAHAERSRPWCARPSPSSSATARSSRRTAGRRMPGANPFTLAVEVAALVAAAAFLEPTRPPISSRWPTAGTSASRTGPIVSGALAARHGVDGHYVRIAPVGRGGRRGRVDVRNRAGIRWSRGAGRPRVPVPGPPGAERADDPRIRATLAVVDACCAATHPAGPAYHRYNGDGYGEHEDGAPFDGTGIGRAWPLLAGERGHFALRWPARTRALPRRHDCA